MIVQKPIINSSKPTEPTEPTEPTDNNKIEVNISPISVTDIELDIKAIVVPEWYPRKYISSEDMRQTMFLLQSGKLGYEKVIVRYVEKNSDKYYELIGGLITFRALQELGRSVVNCELIDDNRLTNEEAIITSLSFNCKSSLNYWESTITGLSYIVEALQLKDKEVRSRVPGIGTRIKTTVSQMDQAIGKCNFVLSKRKEELNISKKDESYYEELKQEVTPKVEQVVDRMTSAIGVDLTTFVQKRIPLTKLPRKITDALSLGKLHYSKAIALSRIGRTNQIKALVDVLHDPDVIDAVNREQIELLQKTLENKWTNSKLNEEIMLANNRILLIGTNEDNRSLSTDEIGNRKEIKEDLKLQADVVGTLTRCRSRLNNFNFINLLTDREKSQFQTKIRSLNTLLIDYEAKVKARTQKSD